MKKQIAFLLTIALLGSAQAAKYELKLGHSLNEQSTWHKAALKFAEEVEKRTKGEVKINVFPSEQLGKELEVVNAIQLGTADMVITGESLQNWAPSASLTGMPYLIRDSAHLRKVANGPIGKQIEEEIKQKVQLTPLTWFERGPRHLTSNRPITKPSDLNGLKLRVPNVPVFVEYWKAAGARPTPMAFSEVFTALQNHAIDAQENPLAFIKSGSLFEVQKYVNETGHVRSWIYLTIGSRKFDSLPAEYQKALVDAAKVAQRYENDLFRKDETQLKKDLQAAGMTFVKADVAAFRAAGQKAVQDFLKPEVRDLYTKIVNTK